MKYKTVDFKETRIQNQLEAWMGITCEGELLYRIFEDNDNFLNVSCVNRGKFEVLQRRLLNVDEGKRIAQKHFEGLCNEVIRRITA